MSSATPINAATDFPLLPAPPSFHTTKTLSDGFTDQGPRSLDNKS